MSEKPKGIFFDAVTTAKLLQDFSNAEIGIVFQAVVEYYNTGTIPTFDDRAVQCLFRALNTWRGKNEI